jgi:hypothetical protein
MRDSSDGTDVVVFRAFALSPQLVKHGATNALCLTEFVYGVCRLIGNQGTVL